MIGVILLITFFPFLWVIRTALTNSNAIFSNTSSLLPVDPTISNFERVLGLVDTASVVGQQASNVSAGVLNFWLYLRNTIIVAGSITIGQSLFSAMAAYAFARFHFPFRDRLFVIYLTGLMVPGIVLFIPNFVVIRQLGWIGTFQGIIAPSFLMTPFAVFFMRQFFLGLNTELEEAALLDGATKFGVFWRIALPLMRGPLLTLAVLIFIGSWNDYLWPLLVGRDESVRVLTVALGDIPPADAARRARLVGLDGRRGAHHRPHVDPVRLLRTARGRFGSVFRLQIIPCGHNACLLACCAA